MKTIGDELHKFTNAFAIPKLKTGQPTILDMCMAPGGFLATALSKNPGASALAFSLPISSGGHKALLPRHPNVKKYFLDITMLAADLDVGDIPNGHPDANNFLPRYFSKDQLFDLALCDGQVLRTHDRASYREKREARRLAVTQLALSLEHLRPGGTVIVLLHKVEAPGTVNLLWMFHKFSSVRVFKPKKGHAKRSSFYMIATSVQSQHPAAIQAVADWKMIWKLATFASDADYHKAIGMSDGDIAELLEGFGSEIVNLGESVWSCQADALENASFIQKRDSRIESSSGIVEI